LAEEAGCFVRTLVTEESMDRAELERLQGLLRAHIVPVVGSDAVDIRVIDVGGEIVVLARVEDRSVRPAVLRIVRQYFPDTPLKFES
jgi:hypothetical protein